MAKKDKSKEYDPVEKVERMNRIFDQLVLPIIVFSIIMGVVSAVIFTPSCGAGCGGDRPVDPVTSQTGSQQSLDPYLMRQVLLEDMESSRAIFEQGGYTVVESEQSGLVAYCRLDENTQIFENIADSSGGRYSAVMYESDSVSVTVRVYSGTIFFVEASDSDRMASAVFRDDAFSTWTSGSDADAAGVFELISAGQLSELVEQYKAKILSLVSIQ